MNYLIKKFGAFSIGPIFGAIIGFITVPLITYFISPEEYGKASMFTLAQGIASMIMYLGMDQAFVREFNTYRGNKNKLFSNAVLIPLILSCALSIVIIIFHKQVSIALFDVPGENKAVLALAVMLPFMVFENFAMLNIRMEENGLRYSGFTILLKLFTLIFTVLLFLLYEKSFRSVIYAIALAEILNGVILLFYTLRSVRIRITLIDREMITRMLKFGIPLVPVTVLVWALSSMDKIMLRSMCTYSELGLYSAASKIVNVLGIVQTCFTLYWTPVAYRWYDEKVSNKRFENVNKAVALLMSVICLIILLLKNVIALILGSEFSDAIEIFPFLLLYPIMYTMSECVAVGIGFTRKTQYNMIVTITSGSVNILLNYLMIPSMGARGAAFATGISYVVFFWMRTLVSRKLWWKFPLKEFVWYTVILMINCAFHTFYNSAIAYFVSATSLLIVILINKNNIREIILGLKAIGNKNN